MKRFIVKCLLFFLPIAVILVPSVWYLERHSELESIEVMARVNQKEGDLIGLAYSDPMHHVKYAILKVRQPEIIALGSSRVLAFRGMAFNDQELFYNCGRSVGKVQDLRSFLSSYPGSKPQVIILGLDQDFFGGDDEDMEKPPRVYESMATTYGSRVIKGTKALFDAVRDKKIVTGDVYPGAGSFIGRNARLFSEGFRRDGSYRYGRKLAGKKDDYLFASVIKRIERRKGRFATSESINPLAVRELEAFLDMCTREGVYVLALMPPYASRVFERLKSERDQFPHVFELRSQLQPLFNERGFKLFDYSDLRSVGSNDYETYDGFHASETAYLKILQLMAKEDRRLEQYVDRAAVKKMLGNLFSARQVVREMEESHPERPTVIGE